MVVTRELPEAVLSLPLRRIHALGGAPAAFLIDDRDAGRILINAPEPDWAEALGTVRYLFLPSARGARHAAFWQAQGAEVLAHVREPLPRELPVRRVDTRLRLTRTIDFLPLPGATPGTCALHLRNLPGAVFAGPSLVSDATGQPVPPAGEDAYLSVIRLAEARFQWLFWDDMPVPAFGPDAARRLRQRLEMDLTD